MVQAMDAHATKNAKNNKMCRKSQFNKMCWYLLNEQRVEIFRFC